MVDLSLSTSCSLFANKFEINVCTCTYIMHHWLTLRKVCYRNLGYHMASLVANCGLIKCLLTQHEGVSAHFQLKHI